MWNSIFNQPFIHLHVERGRTFGKRIREDHVGHPLPHNLRVFHHNRMGPYRPWARPYTTHNQWIR